MQAKFLTKIFKFSQLNNLRCYRFANIQVYTKDHEYINYDDQTFVAKLGITDYAQKELGDIVHVEFPQIGQKISKGNSIGSVESVKMAADVYCPVDGECLAINENVQNDVSLVNQAAEKNWIIQIQITNKQQLEGLFNKEQYEQYLKTVAH